MTDKSTSPRTNACACLYYTPRQPNRDNPLVGSWSITERLIDEDGEVTICTETYTFYRNGALKWKHKIHGFILSLERGTYTISDNRLYVRYSSNDISEEAVFCIIDNKVSLQFDLWKDAIILTKNRG